MTATSESTKVTVLVVDDEPVIRETILEILQEEGFEALGISNATQALSWARRLQPDVVLTDVIMPGLNGIDLASNSATLYPSAGLFFFPGSLLLLT